MLNVFDFYSNLVVRYGKYYADHYFDLWLNFWLSSGDSCQKFDGWRYDMFHSNN